MSPFLRVGNETNEFWWFDFFTAKYGHDNERNKLGGRFYSPALQAACMNLKRIGNHFKIIINGFWLYDEFI